MVDCVINGGPAIINRTLMCFSKHSAPLQAKSIPSVWKQYHLHILLLFFCPKHYLTPPLKVKKRTELFEMKWNEMKRFYCQVRIHAQGICCGVFVHAFLLCAVLLSFSALLTDGLQVYTAPQCFECAVQCFQRLQNIKTISHFTNTVAATEIKLLHFVNK